MKRIALHLLGMLSVGLTLHLQFSSALAQGTGYTLLTTFTNPTPSSYDDFGNAVAVVGTEQVLIGAFGESAGAAYLFGVPEQTPGPPNLAIRFTLPSMVAVSWPSSFTGWILQQNTNGVASVNWSNAPGPIQDDGTTKTLVVPPSAENRFYRLFKP